MRASVLSILAAAGWFAGCLLDRDGSGERGGVAAAGGSGGSAEASVGGGGFAGTGGAPKLDASADGTSTTGGTGGTDKLDAGRDAPADVAHDATFVEDCTNGVDDNGDGLADCADPSCDVVVMCVPKVPTGWTASYVHERTSEQPAPGCGPLAVGPTVYRDLSAAPQQCTCGCASPAGGSCTAPHVELHSRKKCRSGGKTVLSGAGCHSFASAARRIRSIATEQVAVSFAGTCQASVVTTVPPPTWALAADVCTVPETFAGCGSGQVCAPRPPRGFDDNACALRQGDHACPAVGYPAKELLYGAFSDNRDCSIAGCSCGEPTGALCHGRVDVHSALNCSHAIRSFALDGSCERVNVNAGGSAAVQLSTAGPAGGQCMPAGTGLRTGTLTPSNPYTVCCTRGH